MIIYVDNPEDCGIKIGDNLQFENKYRPQIIVTEVRKKEPVKKVETPHFRCPHCNGDLDDYMDA